MVAETSDNRYFDTHGHLPGAAGLAAREAAERLFERLSVA